MATVTRTNVGQKNDTTAATHVFSGVTIPAGKLAIIRLICSDSVTVNNPTDSAGNTWAVAISQTDAGSSQRVAICYSVLTNALSSGTVTINLSATSTCGAELCYFDSDTGWLAQASVLDKTKGAIGSTAAWSTGAAATTTQSEEVLIAACSMINFNGSTSLPDSPWVEETDQTQYSNVGGSGMTTVWQKVNSTGAYTASGAWQNPEFWQAAMATFKVVAVTIPATADHPLVANAPKGFMFRGLSREDFADVAIDYSFFRGATTPRKRFIAAQAGGFYFAPLSEPATSITSADTGVGTDGGLSYISEVISDNPAAYWRLGSSPLVDSSVNGNTLSIPSGTPGSAASLLATDSDGSRDFSGSGQYYIAADSPSVSLTAPLTIEAWVVADAISGDREIVRKDTLQFLFRVESGVIQYYYDDGAARGVSATTSVTTGVLYYLVVTDDGTTVRFYINGVLDRAVARPTGSAAIDTTGAVGVGATHNGGGGAIEFWDGILDEVALYSTSLSATALADHYRAGIYAPVTTTVSISSSDTGVGSEAVSALSQVSADVNGATTEATAVSQAFSSGDTNGTTTETALVTVPISTSDTGSGTENQTLVALISAPDVNGAVTETSTLVAAYTSADTGAGVNNTGTLTALISTPDVNGAVTETALITVPVSSADTGTGSESISTFKLVSPDTATDSEAATLVAIGISSADANGATTEATTLLAVATTADTGTDAEGISDRKSVLEDTSVGTDSQSLLTPGSASDNDTGVGVDAATITKALITATDTGAGSETTTLVASITTPDANGTVTESFAIALSTSDTGTGTENQTIATPVTSSDTGTGTDTVSALKQVTADTGVGTESIATASISSSDSATANEVASANAVLTSADTATGAETQSAGVPISASDTGTGVNNTGTLTALITFSDSALGSDSTTATAQTGAQDAAAGSDTATLRFLTTVGDVGAGINTQTLTAVLLSNQLGTGVDVGTAATAIQKSAADTYTVVDVAVVLIHAPVPSFPAMGTLTRRIGANGVITKVEGKGGYTRVR